MVGYSGAKWRGNSGQSEQLSAMNFSNKLNIKLTHATTNLNAEELEEGYGNRVHSRMRELFNFIAFDMGAGDKRK